MIIGEIGVGSDIYDIFLFLHILAAVVGFGAVLLNGLYMTRARALPASEGLAVLEVNTWVSNKVAEWFILATALFGFGLVGLSDKTFAFSEFWVWLSILVYVAALGVSHGMLRPKMRSYLELQRELATTGGVDSASGGAPSITERLTAAGNQIGAIGAALDLAFVVILILMVFKP